MKKFYSLLFVLLILVGCNPLNNDSKNDEIHVRCIGKSTRLEGASKELVLTGDETNIETLAMMLSIDFLNNDSISKEDFKNLENEIMHYSSKAMNIEVMVEDDFASVYYLIEPFSAATMRDLELIGIELEDGVCSDAVCITMENMKRLSESQGFKCYVTVNDDQIN